MRIGGLRRVSFIDYPGRIGAVVFTQGCNFRCPYCHNPELADPARYGPLLDEGEILSFLERRRGKLDAVTLTGGEPSVQPDLDLFLEKIKKMGYLTKLDTNGSNPAVLETLIRRKLVDYVAMDIKGPLKRYEEIASVQVDLSAIRSSIKLLLASEIEHEFRTTVVRSQLAIDDLRAITKLLGKARSYVLQPFVPTKTIDDSFLSATSYSPDEFAAICKELERGKLSVVVR